MLGVSFTLGGSLGLGGAGAGGALHGQPRPVQPEAVRSGPATTASAPAPASDPKTASDRKTASAIKAARARITASDCLDIAVFLSRDEFEGRLAGSRGGHEAAHFLARQFAASGLMPGGDGGTYFQSFPLPPHATNDTAPDEKGPQGTARVDTLGDAQTMNGLVLHRGTWEGRYVAGVDYAPMPGAPVGRYRGDVVYLGTAVDGTPAAMRYTKDVVSGRVALLVAPRRGAVPQGAIRLLAKQGCVAVVILRGASARGATRELAELLPIPVVELSPIASTRLFCDLATQLLSRPVMRRPAAIRAEVAVSDTGFPIDRGRNVIGILPGVGKKSEEIVIVGAHYDHVGRGLRRGMARGKRGEIHNGANDNASGVAAVLEIADAVTTLAASGHRLERTLVFIAFDAEEMDRRGSRYYVDHPTVSVDRIAAVLNMDMIGRNGRHHIHACKLPAFKDLNQLTAAAAAAHGVALDTARMEMLVARSDIAPFAMRGVPSVCFFSGEHPEYHRETDDAQLLDAIKMQKITRMIFDLTVRCAGHDGSFRPQ